MRALIIAICAGAVLAASSCKSIPDSRQFGPAPATGGKGGNGGAGGTSGSGGGGGSGVCDPTTCSPHAVPGIGDLTSCCATQGGTGCGLEVTPLGMSGCEALGQPGQNDTSCPDQFVGGVTRTGCCRVSDQTCGARMGPLGCVSSADLGFGPGGSCTTTCNATPGASCSYNTDCCDTTLTQTGAVCVTFSGTFAGACTGYCTTNAECGSGCCVLLTTGKGACALNASSCSSGPRLVDEVCDGDADCSAGLVCVAQFEGGPRLCRPSCTVGATTDAGSCAPGETCFQDPTTFNTACARAETVLCTDTCKLAGDGKCEDGSALAVSQDCAYGSDCRDCGTHLGGNQKCDNSCSTARNGICEDSGARATSNTCAWGTDCQDCGARGSICANTCASAGDGVCDYDSGKCALGTDCTDCDVYYGGRGDRKCDGSYASICTGSKVLAPTHGGNGVCECPDCGWDAGDCALAFGTYCDGTSIGGCCAAAGDKCRIGSDGFCDCGGWCGWETDCAYSGVTTIPSVAKCDGSLAPYCIYPADPVLSAQFVANGICDCQGVCSWETDCNSRGYVCTDTCAFNNNGICEDGSTGSVTGGNSCDYGTDCKDCGPRPGVSP